jgi:beta-glucosidase
MGWNIEPAGLTELLTSLHDRYPTLPLMVTENGAAFDDVASADGRVHDPRRIVYLHDHIEAVGAALDAGVDVRGYLVWSLLDNFEWSFGYDRRFGIVRVEPGTLERTRKDSAAWYRELVRTNALPPIDATAPV